MTAREVAQDVLIALNQQERVIEAARRLDENGRRVVRDLLIRTRQQPALDFWEEACDLADRSK